jgi:malonyl-CoA O-methyltransferase
MLQVQQSLFDCKANTYDQFAQIQKLSADFLAKNFENILRLDNYYPRSLLDVGAGTGFASLAMHSYFKKLDITLNDLSDKMLHVAKDKFENTKPNIIKANFDNYIFNNYDLIIANFSLQWSQSIFKTIEKLYNKSNYFCFSTLIKGTFSEVDQTLADLGIKSKFDNYISKKIYIENLNKIAKSEIVIFEKNFPLSFYNLRLFFHYMKNLGAIDQKFALNVTSKRKLIYHLQTNDHTPINSSYKVLYVIMKR